MNKRMAGIAGVAAGIAAALSLVAGFGLRLSPWSLAALCGSMGVLSAAAAVVVVWMRSPAAAREPETPSSDANLDGLFREATANLKNTRAGLHTRPVLFVLGPEGAAKTSAVLNCGLNVEPVAGQLSDDQQVAPTKTANLFLIQDTIAVDAGGPLLTQPELWRSLVARFRPMLRKRATEAPRSALLCVPCDHVIGTREQVDSMANLLRARLREAAETMGVRFPVYVLFTRADRIPFFTEYVSGFSDEEAFRQLLGATFPMPEKGASGLHADQAGQKFSEAFDRLFHALADGRLEQLSREDAAEQRPAIYEFPREFNKLRAGVVRLIVGLDRPSQLVISPFIRGFYFSGVRPVIVSDPDAPVAVTARDQVSDPGGDATRMFQAGRQAAPKPARSRLEASPKPRRVPQWMFLPRLFADVLLADTAARSVSAASVHVSHRLRALLMAAIAGMAVLIALFAVSFYRNASLMDYPRTVGIAPPPQGSATAYLASTEQLRQLDELRSQLETLMQHRNAGHPWSFNWGLYTGDDVRPPADRIYFRRFEQLLFRQVRGRTERQIRALPAVRRDTDEYSEAYDTLKAYLVSTSEHRRPPSDWRREWFSAWLLAEWSAINPAANEEQKTLARRQFEYYATRLRDENPFSSVASREIVNAGRAHLRSFSSVDQNYNRLRARVALSSEPVRFHSLFPDAAPFVRNAHVVDGPYTRKGWDLMTKHLSEMNFEGEEWVRGKTDAPVQNRDKLREEILAAYKRDYIAQWNQYLRRTAVTPYAGPPDAAEKLRVLSQTNTSPLLAAVWVASQHTAVDDNIRKEFGAVHAVIPPAADDSRNFVTTNSQQYTAVLSNLATAIEAYSAGTPADGAAAATQVKLKAIEARNLVGNIAGLLPRGSTDVTVRAVASILEQPVTQFELPDRARAAAEGLNGAGKAFCADWRNIVTRYPFNPRSAMEINRDELMAWFSRPEGRVSKLEAALKSFVQFNGTRYVANASSPVRLNPDFLRFFDNVSQLGRALYPSEGLTEPQLKYTLGWEGSDQITSMSLMLDGQSVTFAGQTPASHTFAWNASPSGQARIDYVIAGGSLPLGRPYPSGPFSIFRFIGDAEKQTESSGGARLMWIVAAGASGTAQQVQGKDLTYQFTVNPSVVTRGFLSGLQCISQVTK